MSVGWEWLRSESVCLMAAAVEFSTLPLHADYAVFYIFSGPLFANLEGYVFLDLLVWGVSPLLFEMVRPSLSAHIAVGDGVSRGKVGGMEVWR